MPHLASRLSFGRIAQALRRLARVPHYCSIKVTQTKNTIGRETGDSDRS
jgi:hypothetical protein